MASGVSEVKRRERETDFSQELVSAKSVPVPHTQPESTRAQICFGILVLYETRTHKFHLNTAASNIFFTFSVSL